MPADAGIAKEFPRTERRRVVAITVRSTGSNLGFGGIGFGVTSVRGDVGGGCRMTCGSGSKTSGGMSGIACSGVSSEGCHARLLHSQPAPRPSAHRLDGSAWTVIMRMHDLKVREHTRGGIGSS